MNNIQDELLQMKIQGYCLNYPNDLDKEWLTVHIKSVQENIIIYCEKKNVWKRKSNTWALLSAISSTFALINRYLEQPLQDDDFFEGNIKPICIRLGNELFCHKLQDPFLFQIIELLAFFVWSLGDPIEKKKFENSSR
jgi:hypothetical protein